jgi:hypothetical protein
MMRSAQQTFRRWFQRADAPTRELISELMNASEFQIEEDDQIDAIVGGPWPNEIPGVVEALCRHCGRSVGLTPDSGLLAAEQFPQARIYCLTCVLRVVANERKAIV